MTNMMIYMALSGFQLIEDFGMGNWLLWSSIAIMVSSCFC
jgi:hypothetical protein